MSSERVFLTVCLCELPWEVGTWGSSWKVCILAVCSACFTATNLHSLLTESSEPLCNTGTVRMPENILEIHQCVFFFSPMFSYQQDLANTGLSLKLFLAVYPFLVNKLTNCVQATDHISFAPFLLCCIVIVILQVLLFPLFRDLFYMRKLYSKLYHFKTNHLNY